MSDNQSKEQPIKGKEEILTGWISKISSYGIRDTEGVFEFYCDEVLFAMEEYADQFRNQQSGEERLFTLKEALEIWDACNEYNEVKTMIGFKGAEDIEMPPDKKEYLKLKFNYDLK